MSTEKSHLALRLESPLQSWGFNSQFNRRGTSLFPTKSAILGICCAALGVARGSEREAAMLSRMRALKLLVVAVPRPDPLFRQEVQPLPVRRLADYHTVQNTRTAEGKVKESHLTWRHYLADASFAAVLTGDRDLTEELAQALRDPRWGLWLGRKACIPTAPVYAGIHETEEEALQALLGGMPLSEFSHQREVERFEEGTDTLPDHPLCFGNVVNPRTFSPRRIKLTEARI